MRVPIYLDVKNINCAFKQLIAEYHHMREEKYLSQHLLPASANLLGICFLVFSFIKVGDLGKTTFLDEMIVAPIILFFISSFLSYFSIRSDRKNYEKAADKIFMVGLSLLALISVGYIIESFLVTPA